MSNARRFINLSLFSLVTLLLTMLTMLAFDVILVTGAGAPAGSGVVAPLRGVAQNLATADSPQVSQVSVSGEFSYPVELFQEEVPNRPDVVGQYSRAANKGSIGLVAHNYFAGRRFYDLQPGMVVNLTYSDGAQQSFVITEIQRYQASVPGDFSQYFIDENGDKVSPLGVFSDNYLKGQLTLQTCLEGEGSGSWGVMFVIAEPLG